MFHIKWLIVAISLAGVAGCSGNSTARPPQEQAKQEWNAARAGVLYGLAKGQYENGAMDKCRQTLDEALRLNPTDARLHILSAKLAIEQGQLEQAQRALDLARGLDEKNPEADYLSGVVYQRWQKPDLALQAYSKASDKAPTEPAYVLARAEMLVAMDRAAEALDLLQAKVTYFEHSSAIRDAVGQLLMQQNRYPQAAAIFREASILASEDASVREHLALALFAAGQYREAQEVLERLLRDEKLAQRADLLTALGECQLQAGQFRQARDSLETAAQLSPGLPGIWLSLSRAAMQTGDLKRADLAIRKELLLEPSSSPAYLLLGYLRVRQEKYVEALAAFQKASALDASDAVSLCMIGYVLEKTGRSDEAMQYYAQALKLKPSDELAAKLMAGVATR